MQKHERIVENVCIHAQIVKGNRPYRIGSHIDTDLTKVLNLRSQLCKRVQCHGTNRDLSKVPMTQIGDRAMTLIEQRHGLSRVQVLDKSFPLSRGLQHKVP